MAIIYHKNKDCNILAKQLAAKIGNILVEQVNKNNKASIAFSGGSTPKKMLQYLAEINNIAWEKIDITLVDERFVDESSNRSNAKMLKENLLNNIANKTNFFPLYSEGKKLDEEEIIKINQSLKTIKQPFDIIILGMGLDGHTASFFPNEKELQKAFTTEKMALALKSSDGEDRISLSLKTILSAKNLFLHIEGIKKQEILKEALKKGNIEQMPIRAILYQQKRKLNIFICES